MTLGDSPKKPRIRVKNLIIECDGINQYDPFRIFALRLFIICKNLYFEQSLILSTLSSFEYCISVYLNGAPLVTFQQDIQLVCFGIVHRKTIHFKTLDTFYFIFLWHFIGRYVNLSGYSRKMVLLTPHYFIIIADSLNFSQTKKINPR